MPTLQFPDAVPALVGESILLRELTENDIASWFDRATDVESADLAGDPVPESMAAGATWLQKHRDQFQSKLGLRWAIVPEHSSVSVGTVGLSFKPGNATRAELGIVVARSSWGKGIGSAATRMLVRYAFSEVGLTEIRAEVLQRNHASVRLLEKAGFSLLQVLPPTAAEPEVLLLYTLFHGGRGVANLLSGVPRNEADTQ
jgi:[ribosomal protein S5]-alanine N-acetyltransferase